VAILAVTVLFFSRFPPSGTTYDDLDEPEVAPATSAIENGPAAADE
jgi:hypothetical protein